MSFRYDKYLKPIIPELDKYHIISFDIFDTLIFRTCYEPEDIFERVGERLVQESGFFYAPATYQALRIEAARRSRQTWFKLCGSSERPFRQIFDEMPFSLELRERMVHFEIEQEKQACYLNENIYSFIKYCKSLGKKVVLVSDMYFSQDDILSFLECAGFDAEIIDGCFVSSDYGANKTSGELFKEVLKHFPSICAHHILHIGDNILADVEGARKSGLDALHYGVVPQEFGSIYDVERKYYNSSLGELASLRKLAGISCEYSPESDEAFFHRVGAEIIGPIYALFADWMVDFAIKNNIEVILPLMREGELFSLMINRVIKRRGLNLECQVFYSSRHTLFAASIFESNEEEKISQLLVKANLSAAHLFDELGLDLDQSGFAKYGEMSLRELQQAGLFDNLRLYMCQNNVRDQILRYAEDQRRLLLRYLNSVTGGRKSVTVDIGMKGTAESLFEDIIRMSGSDISLSHVLMVGASANNVTNIMNGVKIYSWLGIAGENSYTITKIMYHIQVFEALTSAVCGTALRYKENCGEVIPILDDNNINAVHARQIEACWSGAGAFQLLWLDLLEQKPQISDLIARKTSLLNIWLRFLEMPTPREAEIVGSLFFYDPFSYKAPEKLCNLSLDENVSDSEIELMLESYQRKHSYWPQAAVVKARPHYFMQKFICSCTDIPFINAMYSIIDEIKRSKTIKNTVIFAAAQRGRDFLRASRLFDVPIYCFVDSNKRLQGKYVAGKKVIAPEQLNEDIDAIVVASALYSDEICEVIQRHYSGCAKQPLIFCL